MKNQLNPIITKQNNNLKKWINWIFDFRSVGRKTNCWHEGRLCTVNFHTREKHINSPFFIYFYDQNQTLLLVTLIEPILRAEIIAMV